MKKYLKFLMLGIAVAAVLEPLQVIAQESIPPIVVTTTRVPNGPPSPVWLPPIVVMPAPEDLPSDNSGSTSLTSEGAKEIVGRYVLPCRKPDQNIDAYSLATKQDCTAVSYQRALDENLALRMVPEAIRLTTRSQIGGFCSIRVEEQVGSGQVKTC